MRNGSAKPTASYQHIPTILESIDDILVVKCLGLHQVVLTPFFFLSVATARVLSLVTSLASLYKSIGVRYFF